MKYKVALMSPLGLLPFGAQTATAADMPVKAPPIMLNDPSWAGLYAGVNIGMLSARSSLGTFLPTSSAPASHNYCWQNNCNFSGSQTATGVLGGIQVGYNFQSGKIIYGVEADFDLASAKNSSTTVSPTDPNFTARANTGIDSFGTARLRLGYAFDRNIMAYATGGLAYAKARDSFQASYTPNGSSYSWTGSSWRAGYTVGGGLEYMINPKWSVKGEALYYDLGKKSVESGGIVSGSSYSHGITDRMTGVIGRIGLNYLFH